MLVVRAVGIRQRNRPLLVASLASTIGTRRKCVRFSRLLLRGVYLAGDLQVYQFGCLSTLASSTTWGLQQTRSLRLTRSLGQAINLLKFSNRELAAFLSFHEAVNPHISLGATGGPRDLAAGRAAAGKGAAADPFPVDQIAGTPAGLHEHAWREICLVLSSTRERSIARHFLEALEATGWLGRPVADIARDAGCDPSEAEAVLEKIQHIDPPGLFARSLAECLRLQAEDAEVLTEDLACLLDNLPMLARGEFDELAKVCGCSRKDIAAHFATIRGFNPKPGLAFGGDDIGSAAPDLVVTMSGDSIEVDLNRSSLPTITVREATGLNEADQRMLDAAKSVARAVERRNISTLQIATEIIRRQPEFLRNGPASLKPLTLRDVAEATGVHESTVSRVTAGLRMDTPRGPMGLRDFFSGALATQGDPISSAAVRTRIGEMIKAEDPAQPLSDAEIAARLSADGIQIARRTVTKYREGLRLPGIAARRRGVSSRRS